jgi:hypothetical protein
LRAVKHQDPAAIAELDKARAIKRHLNTVKATLECKQSAFAKLQAQNVPARLDQLKQKIETQERDRAVPFLNLRMFNNRIRDTETQLLQFDIAADWLVHHFCKKVTL